MVQKMAEMLTKKIMWPQYVASIAVTLLLIEVGLMTGWSSPYIAKLTSPDSSLPVTMSEASWIVSLLNFGRLIGAVSGAVLVNYLGSKTAVLMTSKPIAVYWICTMVANDVWWLYVARFCGGLSLGMCYSCFPLYLAEIADPKIRGALMALGICGMSVGNLLICIMGAYLKMEVTGLINLLLCLLLIAMLFKLPESPHYFIRRKDIEKAKRSILWYHRDCDVQAELATLSKFVMASENQSFLQIAKELKLPPIRRALMVSLGLYIYSQICGLNNVLFYMESILREARVTIIQPAHVVIIVMVFGIGASLLSICLVDRYGRRFLMCLSCSLVTISLAGLGAQFQLIDLAYDVSKCQWLPILSVILFQVAVYIGIIPVPSTVAGEIFPSNVKCVAASLGSLAAGISSFVSTATYLPLVQLLSSKYTFWFYGMILLTAVPVTIVFVPETKGKSLQEIQDELINR